MAHDVDRAPGRSIARHALRRLSAIRREDDTAREVALGQELEALREHGYVVMHDFGLGEDCTIDHMVAGPNGVFMIETKLRPFEAMHLALAKRRASRLEDELACWVTPVICVDAHTHPFVHEGVLIAARGQLVAAIRAQPRHQGVDTTRLRRFSDFLD